MTAFTTFAPWWLIAASGVWLLAGRVADAVRPGSVPLRVSRASECAIAIILLWLVASDPSLRAALGVRLERPAIDWWGFGGAGAMILASVAHARWLPSDADRRPASRWFHAHNVTVIPWLEEVVFRGALVHALHAATGQVVLPLASGLAADLVLHAYQGWRNVAFHAVCYGIAVVLVFSPGGLVAAVIAHHIYNLFVAAGDWHRARTP